MSRAICQVTYSFLTDLSFSVEADGEGEEEPEGGALDDPDEKISDPQQEMVNGFTSALVTPGTESWPVF